jgi:hypothetical protein
MKPYGETKEEQIIKNAYRSIIDTPDGMIVLEDLLLELRWFDKIEKPEDGILHNVALRILNKLGIMDLSTTEDVVKKLLSIQSVIGGDNAR